MRYIERGGEIFPGPAGAVAHCLHEVAQSIARQRMEGIPVLVQAARALKPDFVLPAHLDKLGKDPDPEPDIRAFQERVIARHIWFCKTRRDRDSRRETYRRV